MNMQRVKENLVTFLKEEVAKIGLKSVTLGLSGGLDSAVVALLCKEAFGENVTAVIMPSKSSSKSSVDDALKLCEKFNITYKIVDISPMVEAYLPFMDNDKLRIGNFCARVRMSVLYDFSSKENSLVIGTSNKSERALGYGTIFGDLACAINPIGEIYKSDLFEFAKFLGVIDEIIVKKPSADLWEGQSDEEELGFSYKELDSVLRLFIDKKLNTQEIISQGFSTEIVALVENRVAKNRFKGELPKIAKDFGESQ